MSPDPPRLIAGPYRPPRLRRGRVAYDVLRGDLVVVGTSEAPIAWPVACTRAGSRPTPVMSDELIRAVRTESRQAISYWFGVSLTVAWRWRRALHVERFNAGTRDRWRELARTKLTEEGRRIAHQRMRAAFARRRATAEGAGTISVDSQDP